MPKDSGRPARGPVQGTFCDSSWPRERQSRRARLIKGDDGLIAERVNKQTKEKHKCLTDYIELSSPARKRFIGAGNAGATLIDLYCGTGRAQVIGTGEWIDGSAVAAWETSRAAGAPFSKIYIADLDDRRRVACAARLKARGAPVKEIHGSAVEAIRAILGKVDRYGLHLALLDPYNLESLDFAVIEALATLRRPDLLIHLSAMDLQRNVGAKTVSPAWDAFAPGWRERVDFTKSRAEIRRQLVQYWHGLLSELGVWTGNEVRLITGERRQRLYWLVLAAKSGLAHRLWKAASNTHGQKDLPLFGPTG